MKQGQFPAVIKLADLNGQNGFKIYGENGDQSGFSVSAAGDINSDGYDDLIIGAWSSSSVVFGGPRVGNTGLFTLSSLNGTNGFRLYDPNPPYYSSWYVNAAGDINSDGHDDLIIGNGASARSYVVFGGSEVGVRGVFNLSSLNGANGFKLNGENVGDNSGQSVSAGRDINSDGYTDLIIGADGYKGGSSVKGRSYVVLGGPGVGSGGLFNLSSLMGINGFKLDGENSGDHSGFSVSMTEDINNDGQDDLIIGAYFYPGAKAKGRSYVVFGGLGAGSGGTIPLSELNGANGFKLDGEYNGDLSGSSVSAAGDINGDGHADLIIGSPRYNRAVKAAATWCLAGQDWAAARRIIFRVSRELMDLNWMVK